MELGRKWVNNNNHLSVLFRPLVNSVKDEHFQSTSDFYQVVLCHSSTTMHISPIL